MVAVFALCLSGCGGCGKKKEEATKTANDFNSGIEIARSVIAASNAGIDTVLSGNEAVKQQGIDFFKSGFFDGLKLFDSIEGKLFYYAQYLNEDQSSWADAETAIVKLLKETYSGVAVKRNAEDDYTITYKASDQPAWLEQEAAMEVKTDCVYDPNHGWIKVVSTETAFGQTVENSLFELYRNGDVYVLQTENERLMIEFEKVVDEKSKETSWNVKWFTYSQLEQGRIPNPEKLKKITEDTMRILNEMEASKSAPESSAAEEPSSSAAAAEDSEPLFLMSVAPSSSGEAIDKHVIPEMLGSETVYGHSGVNKYSSLDSVFDPFPTDVSWVTKNRDECAIIIEYAEGGFTCYNRNKLNYKVEKWVVKDNVAICYWGEDMSPLTEQELSDAREEITKRNTPPESSSGSN